mmetsp:Transcript_11450/g.17321  ORF Transcript_11450/g.17321 Transcript_11450/m.17321 type:complete len:287 (-) Transcript_11450:53-913(-)
MYILSICIDPVTLYRTDKDSLPRQTLMELLVSNLDDKAIFRDSNGDFYEISDWNGVALDDSGEVTEINWERDDGYSFFDEEDVVENSDLPKQGGSIDLKWLPSTVTDVTISDLCVQGTINTYELPRSLVVLDVRKNAFEGSFDIRGLPAEFRSLWGSENRFLGSVLLEALPDHMHSVSLSQNSFSGTLALNSLPETLLHLYLSNNKFCGVLDLSNLSASLTYVRLEENEFYKANVLIVPKTPMTCVLSEECFVSVQDIEGNAIGFAPFHGHTGNVRLLWPEDEDAD